MHRIVLLRWGTAMSLLALACAATSAAAQDAPTPGPSVGCTTSNGASSGTGCRQGVGNANSDTETPSVENGMPATRHQQKVLQTDEKAVKGQNMQATGAGGATMPATQHQQDVLQKQNGGTGASKP